MAYGGTISEILDLKQVNGLVTDSAGFGLTGVATSNSDPDYSNAGPYISTAVNKLIIQSSGTRNPFGLALDGSGNLWFTNNFNRSQSDGTFNGTIDPSTGLLYGITTGDPAPGRTWRTMPMTSSSRLHHWPIMDTTTPTGGTTPRMTIPR